MCKCTAVLCLFFYLQQQLQAQWCRFSSSITICLHTFLRGFSLEELKYYTKKLLCSKRISNQLKVVSTFQQPKAYFPILDMSNLLCYQTFSLRIMFNTSVVVSIYICTKPQSYLLWSWSRVIGFFLIRCIRFLITDQCLPRLW